jgi:N-methylhydantoinase A
MKVGIDVGGTFTDLFGFAADGGTVTSKVPSTPPDFTAGVLNALEAAGITPADIETLVHGSTIATNAVIERRLPVTTFLTTKGFRDLVQIGRYHRPRLYDPYGRKPPPLIPRRAIFEVPERIGSRGEVVHDLDEVALRQVAETLRRDGVEAVGIGFLNAYANPVHEHRARDVLADELPAIPIALSTDVSPKVGALGRFSTTMLSAALRPVAGAYVDTLSRRLQQKGFGGSLWFIISSGGVMAAREVGRRPEHLFVSGPAGGVQGAIEIGHSLGAKHLITMDMGGTSCDVTMIEGDRPFITSGYEIDFDLPLMVPTIDIRTIGAGGGSIAAVDPGGILQVGPRSAGAIPGPACYGRGGHEATVTDADLVLGYLDPDRFLGGEMPLDRWAAESALGRLGEQLELELVAAAVGVVRVVNEHMAAAIREVSIDRGRDPRDYTLMPFGGAGPVHGLAVAEIIGIPRVVIPPEPEVLSAFGATALDVTYDAEATYYVELAHADMVAVETRFRGLEARAQGALVDQGIEPASCSLSRVAELRYVGQTYEVPVDAPADLTVSGALAALQTAFHGAHASRYGVSDPDSPVALVNLRATAVSTTDKPPRRHGSGTGTPVSSTGRQAYFPDVGWQDVSVYQRSDLPSGWTVAGPAIVEQRGSTVVIPRGWGVTVDEAANLVAGQTS